MFLVVALVLGSHEKYGIMSERDDDATAFVINLLFEGRNNDDTDKVEDDVR